MKVSGSWPGPLRQWLPVAVASLVAVLLGTVPALAQAPVGSIAGARHGSERRGRSPGQPSAPPHWRPERRAPARRTTRDIFMIPTLKPGEYLLKVSSKGFAEFVAPRVVVEVGQTARVDAALTVQALNEQRRSDRPASVAVDTSQTTVGGVVNLRADQRAAAERAQLPRAGAAAARCRDSGRAAPSIRRRAATRASRWAAGTGARRASRSTASTPSTSTSAPRPSTSRRTASRSSRSRSSSSDPSAGLSATGAINIITKRGSNDLHGSGFLFGRGSDYAARPSFAATAPDFDRKQFGGNFGGPAIKDRLFWFANVEKTKENAAIGISTPYFPDLTSYKAPFDVLSTTVRADWRVSRRSTTCSSGGAATTTRASATSAATGCRRAGTSTPIRRTRWPAASTRC